MKKRFLAVALAMTMVVGMNQTVVSATETQTEALDKNESVKELPVDLTSEYNDGYLAPNAVEVTEVLPEQIWNEEDNLDACGGEESAYWDKYTSDSIENILQEETQKAAWKNLESACEYFLTSDETAEGTKYVDVSSFGLTTDNINSFVVAFLYAHPQYYFLNCMNTYYHPVQNSTAVKDISFSIYEEYRNGKNRAEYTDKFEDQIEEWITDIKATGTTYAEREQEAHDLICDEIVYDYQALADQKNGDNTAIYFDQSAASAVFYKLTVCAGYTKLFSLLMNGLDDEQVEAVGVTSQGHAWNEIIINGKRYAVDTTWGDQDSYTIYNYYNKDYATYNKIDSQEAHVKEAFWDEWITEECVSDGVENRTSRLAAPMGTVDDNNVVTLMYRTAGQKYGETIYYTVNGEKEEKYTQPIEIAEPTTIQAYVTTTTYQLAKSRVITFVVESVCNIQFDANGGSGEMSTLKIASGSTTNLTANIFTREGYTFTGWNTAADGSGTTYVDGASVQSLSASNNDVVTLYAQWEKKVPASTETSGGTTAGGTSSGGITANNTTTAASSYQIKFAGNGSTSGTMSNLTNCKYGTSYKLTVNKYKKKGYKFTGWNTKANGKGISYANTARVSSLTKVDKATVTLYAQWKKVKYKITYKLAKGKNSSKNKKYYYVTTATTKLKNPTRKGYAFKGWYTTSKYKKKITKIKKGSTGNIVLYAKWKKK